MLATPCLCKDRVHGKKVLFWSGRLHFFQCKQTLARMPKVHDLASDAVVKMHNRREVQANSAVSQ